MYKETLKPTPKHVGMRILFPLLLSRLYSSNSVFSMLGVISSGSAFETVDTEQPGTLALSTHDKLLVDYISPLAFQLNL